MDFLRLRVFDAVQPLTYLHRMRKTSIAMVSVVVGLGAGAASLRPLSARPVYPPGHALIVPIQGVDDGGSPFIPGHEPEPGVPKSSEGAKPPEPQAPTRAESLDALFGRLAKATDPGEATGIAALIQRLWMQSGSDTADLLMARAMMAMSNDNHALARTLLDRIVILRPGWAEAWNKRATLRFLDDDDAGSMDDIGHTLGIEPRHFGALSGLGFILKRNGLEKAALKALRRAEEIYPESSDIKKAVEDLIPEVEGRDL